MAKKKPAKSNSSQGMFGKHTKLDLLLVLLVGVIIVVFFAKWYNDQVNTALAPMYNQPVQLYNHTPSITPTITP